MRSRNEWQQEIAQHLSKNRGGDGNTQKEDIAMVKHKIAPNRDGYSVRIYDAPAGGIRILFGQKCGAINIYTKYEDAVAGVRIYDCADKTVLFDAELEVYLQAACTGAALGDCGLSSLVRFGEPDHCAYATFILSEEYIRRSDLKIIGYKGEGAAYSLGWDLHDR
jgi:hypothetical protein